MITKQLRSSRVPGCWDG